MKKIGNSMLLTFFFMTFISQSVWAQDIQVFATVDRNEMGIGDTFTYSISVSSKESVNLDEPKLPNILNFDMVNNWSSTQSQSNFVNGSFEVQQTRSFNYMLSPKKSGNLVLGSAQIEVNGKTYHTKPISLKVSDQPSMKQAQPQHPFPDDMEDMEDVFNQLLQRRSQNFRTQPSNPSESFFIQAEVDKTEAYAGEQITASWYLYTRGQIRDIDTLKYPSVSGFWKEDIELATRLNFQQEVINGMVYKKALLASYALFPLKAGKATVDEYKAKCTVLTPSNFGFGRPYQYTKSSKPIKIQVKPVPTVNRPEDFSGAVGQFAVSAELDQKNIPVNQPVSLKIRFEGRGNAKLIDLPPLNLPPSLELYDTQSESKFFRDGRSFKEFRLLLIPREAGPQKIPSIGVSVFNPQTGRFVSQQTPEMEILAHPGEGQDTIESSPLAGGKIQKSEPVAVMPGLLLEWSEASRPVAQSKKMIWPLIYFLVMAFLFWKARQELGWAQGRKDLLRSLKPRLQKLSQGAEKGDWRGVGRAGTNLFYFVLGEISGLGGASRELDKLLLEIPPSVRRELGEEFKKLLNYFETLSFAPEGAVGPLKEVKFMKDKISALEKSLVKAVHLAEKRQETGDSTPQPEKA